jgi:hypothetical protein
VSKRLSQADQLRQYNHWRRGEDSIPYPDPKELGELLDCVADRLEVLEREHEALKLGAGGTANHSEDAPNAEVASRSTPLACPFCDEFDVEYCEVEPGTFAIDCPSCQCIGPFSDTAEGAVIAWNCCATAARNESAV